MAKITPISLEDYVKLTTEKSNAANESKSFTKSDLLKELEKVDSKFKDLGDIAKDNSYINSIPDSLNLKKLEYDNTTDDELMGLAKKSLQEYYGTELNKINTNSESKAKALQDNKNSLKNSLDDAVNSVTKGYEKIKTEAEKQAIKRGLARSSIVMNQLQDYDSGLLNDVKTLQETVINKAAEIDDKIQSLEDEKALALNNFEITYASKLEEKIDKLKNEREELNQYVTKFNNDVNKAETDYQIKRANMLKEYEEDNYDNYVKNSSSNLKAVSNLKDDAKRDLIKSYLDSIPVEQAIREFTEDASMQFHLGRNYNYMLNYLEQRKEKESK